MACNFREGCPVSLLFRSFYDKNLAERFIEKSKGIGLMPLFVLAVLVAVVQAVYAFVFMTGFSPELISEKVVSLPEIEIRDGRIVRPENFFQRYRIGDGLHLVLDTTGETVPDRDLAPNEIYVGQNGVRFSKGGKIELFPLKKLFGTDSVVLTKDKIVEYGTMMMSRLKYFVPSMTLAIGVPLHFFKYVLLAYLLALGSYFLTLFPYFSVPFEERMRLAVVSCLPVFVYNLIFGTLLGIFSFGPLWGTMISMIYMMYYLLHLKAFRRFVEENAEIA